MSRFVVLTIAQLETPGCAIGTFFTLQGALKTFCDLTGEKLDDTIDDYC